MKILNKFHPKNPCEEGTECLVRASCRLSFWRRDIDCEMFKKYQEKRNRFRKMDLFITNLLFHMIFWPVASWIVLTFIAGLVLQGAYIWTFIQGFFS